MDDLTPDSPQDHLRTHHNPFGIRADDALAHASLLLKGAYELTDIGLGHSGVLWSVLHLVEGAGGRGSRQPATGAVGRRRLHRAQGRLLPRTA